MEGLGLIQLAFASLVVILAFAVRGTAGFGGGAVAVPLLALVLPIQVAIPVVTVLAIISSLGHWIRDWRKIVWREIARVAPFTLAGVLVGLQLFRELASRTLTQAFGVFVIAYAIFAFATAGRLRAPPLSLIWPLAIGLSTLAGLIGTLFGGAAGPLYVIYLNTLRLEKDAFRVTVTTMLMTLAMLRVAGYARLGFYDTTTLTVLAAALPMMLVGARIGRHIAGRIDQRTFNRTVGLVLMVSGAALVLK